MMLTIGAALLAIAAVVLVMAIDYLFGGLDDQGEPEDCDQ